MLGAYAKLSFSSLPGSDAQNVDCKPRIYAWENGNVIGDSDPGKILKGLKQQVKRVPYFVNGRVGPN